jgi:pimeloyl-ACP methyl ester carboxylesterase
MRAAGLLLALMGTEAAAGEPYPKIFIHGTDGRCEDWEPMIRSIADGRPDMGCLGASAAWAGEVAALGPVAPDSFWNFDPYVDVQRAFAMDAIVWSGIETYAERLELFVEQVKLATGAEKVILVGHSQGGLIIRRYMANSDHNWGSVHRFVTAGTPHLGIYGLLGWQGGPWSAFCGIGSDATLVECMDMDDSSPFIHRLYDDWWDFRTRYQGDPELAANRTWAIVAGSQGNQPDNDPLQIDGGVGEGIVEVWSSMPGEWYEAATRYMGQAGRMTPNYGYRRLADTTHAGLPGHDATRDAIRWADSHDDAQRPSEPGISLYLHPNFLQGWQGDFRSAYPLTFTTSRSSLDHFLVETSWCIFTLCLGDNWDEGLLFENSVSSVSIDAPAEVVLYRDGYSGSQLTLAADAPHLGAYAFDDMLSSFLLVPPDSDHDGISDHAAWLGEQGDRDADGLSTFEEQQMGTDPDRPDSDGDGLDDGREILLGSEPLDVASTACDLPEDGDWTITTSCQLLGHRVAPGDVTIGAGALLQLEAEVRLGVDLAAHHIKVDAGAGLQLAAGSRAGSGCGPGEVAPAVESCNGWDDDCDGRVDEPGAAGCRTWFIDEDQDGYGAIGQAGACLCDSEGPYTAPRAEDCYDQNPSARPGQAHHFVTDRGDGSFDYDCSGTQTPHLPSTFEWRDDWGQGCRATRDGWVRGVAACGTNQEFANDAGCHWSWWSCNCGPENTFYTVQSCR